MSAEQIIARCTRDGVVSWQNVAAQLGCSVDQARKLHDPQYLAIRPWPQRCEAVTPKGEPIELVDENDTHSLAPKGPGLAVEILRALKRHGPMSAQAISGLVGSPCNSVRMRLARMLERKWVVNDSRGRGNGVFEWTWAPTAEGLKIAEAGSAPSIRDRVQASSEAA
jgi:hypothetical protein